MDFAFISIGTIVLLSFVFTALLLKEYLRVTRKRRELIAALGGSGKAVPFLKRTLMMSYIISSAIWTIGLAFYFFFFIA